METFAMTKVLVLYYSSYGHIEQMADAVAEGAREGGAEVAIRRVAETAPDEIVKAAGFKTDTAHPLIEGPDALADYDAIIVGAPTRYGRMPSQMAAFWDTTGGLWFKGALIGKVGGAFTSTASQHGGQETTLFSLITNLMHHGMSMKSAAARPTAPPRSPAATARASRTPKNSPAPATRASASRRWRRS
jgi:NAD(P)H dehydrogenase (quinone)